VLVSPPAEPADGGGEIDDAGEVAAMQRLAVDDGVEHLLGLLNRSLGRPRRNRTRSSRRRLGMPDGCSEDRASARASPAEENTLVKQVVFFRPLDSLHPPIRLSMGTGSLQKPCSRRVWWAREELNLRPLPCQIQRVCAGLNVGWLEIGKDRRKAAGERTCQCPSHPTICLGSLSIVLIPMPVGCCLSAARATPYEDSARERSQSSALHATAQGQQPKPEQYWSDESHYCLDHPTLVGQLVLRSAKYCRLEGYECGSAKSSW
jgi:hypothetical protein